jgi:hypothetical protein
MTTPQEIGQIMEDMANEVNDTFNHDTTASALIRHFHFIHRNITYLTQEVMRHQLERQEVYDYMMENPGFRMLSNPCFTTTDRGRDDRDITLIIVLPLPLRLVTTKPRPSQTRTER